MHPTSRRRRGLLALLASLAVVTSGCVAPSTDEPSGTDSNVITFAANFELSGPASLYGVSKVVGARVARDLINESGGIKVDGKSYQLEIVECDNRSEATFGVQCAQQAVDDGALWTSAPDLGFEGAYEIYKQNNILTVGNGGSASVLVNEKLAENPLLTFEFLTYQQTVESNLKQTKALYPEVKTIATMLPNDANGQVQDAAYRELAPKYGLKVVAQQLIPTDATGDFSTYLTKLKAAKPDMIHLGYYPQVASAALEQGAALGAAKYFSADGLTFSDLEGVNFDGVNLAAFQYGWNWFDGFGPQNAKWRDVIKRFDKAANGQPYLPSVAVLGFIGDVYMIKQAIETADSLDPKAIAAALPTATFDGPFGPAKGLENRAVDQARTPFTIDETGKVQVYEFPTGLSDNYTKKYDVATSPLDAP